MRGIISLFLSMFLFISCATTRYVPPQIVEKVKTEYVSRVDTTIVRDSVWMKEYIKADTVFLTKEKYKYITKIKTDTLHRVDTIPVIREVQVDVPYVPERYRKTDKGFWVLLSILLLLCGWKIYKIIK